MSKPKLIPLPVPWNISEATPMLTLTSWEGGGGQSEVQFLGNFLVDGKEIEHRITVAFKVCVRSSMSPTFSERVSLDVNLYDQSEIDSDFRMGVPILDGDGWLARYLETWTSTGICPTPNVYEIQDSEWTKPDYVSRQNLKHYVFIGEDKYVEVLGKDWTWKSEEIEWEWSPKALEQLEEYFGKKGEDSGAVNGSPTRASQDDQ